MRKILVSLIAVIALLGITATANASSSHAAFSHRGMIQASPQVSAALSASIAQRRDISGLNVCTVSGNNYCWGITNLIVGNNVVDKTSANARNMTLHTIDNNCDPRGFPVCERVQWRFYNGDYAAEQHNCGGTTANLIVNSDTDTTGTVMIAYEEQSGPWFFSNQLCFNSNQYMYSDDVSNDAIHFDSNGSISGHLYRWNF